MLVPEPGSVSRIQTTKPNAASATDATMLSRKPVR